MTVCIGAIAEKSTVISVSDRMLTAGDVEFEPGQAKFWGFSTSIVALISGDTTIQAEIFNQVHKETQNWINADPAIWINVRDVALLYVQKYRELRRQWAEAAILHPLGLDIQSFLANQATMERELVGKIADKLTEYEFPSVLETIFMGMDNDGPLSLKGEKLNYPQLFVTEYDRLSCLNTVGFAAIGSGKSHAESQFMFSGHLAAQAIQRNFVSCLCCEETRGSSSRGWKRYRYDCYWPRTRHRPKG